MKSAMVYNLRISFPFVKTVMKQRVCSAFLVVQEKHHTLMQSTFSWSIPNSLSYTVELFTFSWSFLATARAYKESKQITSRKHDQIYHCQQKKYLKTKICCKKY